MKLLYPREVKGCVLIKNVEVKVTTIKLGCLTAFPFLECWKENWFLCFIVFNEKRRCMLVYGCNRLVGVKCFFLY